MNCHYHSEKEAVGACVGCGKFICAECKIEIKEKNYCKKCISEMLSEKDKKLESLENRETLQNIIVNDSDSNNSSYNNFPAAYGPGAMNGAPPFPTNSVGIHILLLLFTGGVGNIIYFLYVKSQQNKWYDMYY